MRRSMTLAALALTAAVSYGLYDLKYEVARLEDELARLNRELIAERQAVRVLKAEWSYLNRPRRLQELAARHLELEPVPVYRLSRLEQLPTGAPGEDSAPAAAPPLPVPKPPRGPGARGPAILASTRQAQ